MEDKDPIGRKKVEERMAKARMKSSGAVDTAKVRCVLYSETNGIYLGAEEGKSVWSKINPGNRKFAPTFLDGSNEAHNYITINDNIESFPETKAVVIFPTGPKALATKEDCAKVLLPTWEEGTPATPAPAPAQSTPLPFTAPVAEDIPDVPPRKTPNA